MAWLSTDRAESYPDLDLAYLDRLAAVVGEEKLRELLSDGLIELVNRVQQLRRLERAGRRSDLAAVAHDMIGAAGHMGLTRLSLAATDIERKARDSDDPLGDEVTALEVLADSGLDALKKRIDAPRCG